METDSKKRESRRERVNYIWKRSLSDTTILRDLGAVSRLSTTTIELRVHECVGTVLDTVARAVVTAVSSTYLYVNKIVTIGPPTVQT